MNSINPAQLIRPYIFLLPLAALFGFPLVESKPMVSFDMSDENDYPYLIELNSLRQILNNYALPAMHKLYGKNDQNMVLTWNKIKKIDSIKRDMKNGGSELKTLQIALRLAKKFYFQLLEMKEYQFNEFHVIFGPIKQNQRDKILGRLEASLNLVIHEVIHELTERVSWLSEYYFERNSTSDQKLKLIKIHPNSFSNIVAIDFYFIDLLNNFLNISIEILGNYSKF